MQEGLVAGELIGSGAAMCDNGELFAVSSGGDYFARTYQITNDPALKIQGGSTIMNGSTIVNGNVGIGTTSPIKPLDVHGDVMITGTTSSHNDIHYPLYVRTYSSSNTAVEEGIGTGIQFGVERQDTNDITSTGWIHSYGSNNIPGHQDGWNMGFKVRDNDTIREVMTFKYNSYVGIGTTSPAALLDVNSGMRAAYNTNTASYFGRAAIGYTGHNDWASFCHVDCNNTSKFSLLQNSSGKTILNSASGQRTEFQINNVNHMYLLSDGTFQANGSSNLLGRIFTRKYLHFKGENNSSREWFVGPWDTIDFNTAHDGVGVKDFAFAYGYNTDRLVGYLDHSDIPGYLDFTGQHRGFIENIPSSSKNKYNGLIVSANKNEYFSISKGRKIQRGKKAIEIDESLPYVSLSCTNKDKSCYGVISGFENDNRQYSNGILQSVYDKTKGDYRAFINSLGEGAIWVSNKNGSMESGDYITTSSIPGYGQKQDSEFLANYSVAKITMDCDFQPPLQYIKQVKKVNFDFTSDASGNYFDMSGNLLFGYDNSGNKVNKNTVYDLEFEGDSLNLISVKQNILDENGEIQWEDTTEQETKYEIRHIDPSGNILTEEQYNTKIAAGEEAYIAAFVGCTYHCG